MKIPTVIILGIISVVELFVSGDIASSVSLWMFYGMYSVFKHIDF